VIEFHSKVDSISRHFLQAIIQISKSQIEVFQKHLSEETYFILSKPGYGVVKLLIDKFNNTKDLEMQKLIIKAMLIPGMKSDASQVLWFLLHTKQHCLTLPSLSRAVLKLDSKSSFLGPIRASVECF
jgi:hypothetical protein